MLFRSRVARSKTMIAAMCSKRRPPAMSIPADPERDEDLFITDTLDMLLAAAQRAERAEAEVEKMREMFNARGEVCTAVRSGISAMQNGTARDALVAEAETYAALNRLMALEKQDAALAPQPAEKPWDVPENWSAVRNALGNVMWYENAQAPPGMGIRNAPPDAGGAE